MRVLAIVSVIFIFITKICCHNKSDESGKKIRLNSCCPDNHNIVNYICEESQPKLDFSNLTIYDVDLHKTNKKFKDLFDLIPPGGHNFDLDNSSSVFPDYNSYLKEDGFLMLETPNIYDRWIKKEPELFCIGFEGNDKKPKFWAILDDDDDDDGPVGHYFVITALLISSFFLVLVLMVYLYLPELRNLGGKVLMANVVSLLGAFMSLASLHLFMITETNTANICLSYTFMIYYFFLANFCWMNIMSFDIWWTFRVYTKSHPIHRRGENVKFLTYCLYGFGVPLALTVMLILLNQANLRHIPWFIIPNILSRGCFFTGMAKVLYLYVPMLILIVGNWVFFLMTGYNIWSLRRGTSMLDSTHGKSMKNRTQKHRFMVYLKLSVVMGISWVLEMVSAIKPDSKIFYITDAYNLLLGVFIFLIFCCKRKILKKIINKYRSGGLIGGMKSRSNISDTIESERFSIETPSQVCQNPKGTEFH